MANTMTGEARLDGVIVGTEQPSELEPERKSHDYLPLLTLPNLFRVNSQWVDGDRAKMALRR